MGWTSGIGRATATAFARAGAKVLVAGSPEPEGAETVRLMREAGGEGLCVKTNVSVGAEVAALVHRTKATSVRLGCAYDHAGADRDLGDHRSHRFMDSFGMTKDHTAAAAPMGRMGTPEDIGSAVPSLC